MSTQLAKRQSSPPAEIPHSSLSLAVPEGGSALTRVMQSGEAAGILARMYIARQFPRNEIAAVGRIRTACQRRGLAEQAQYSFKRGSEQIEGPTIRLLEVCAAAWGNIDHGWREIDRRTRPDGIGISTIEAAAVDLETNFRKTVLFDVLHWRDTKSGGYALKDERDIYEALSNQASRRLRKALEAVIPGDIVADAIIECEETLKKAADYAPLADRVRECVLAYADLGVTQEMIEARIQHNVASITEPELRALYKLKAGIENGHTTAKKEFVDAVEAKAGAQTAPPPAAQAQESQQQPSAPAPTAKTEAPKSDGMLASEKLGILVEEAGWGVAAAEKAMQDLKLITNGLATVPEPKAQRILENWTAKSAEIDQQIQRNAGAN